MPYHSLRIYCHLILFFLFVNFGIAQKNTADLEDKKVLIVYGGWHGHEPKIFAEKIAKWLLEQKAEVKLFEGTAIYANPKVMKDLDLIIQHITMDEITLQNSSMTSNRDVAKIGKILNVPGVFIVHIAKLERSRSGRYYRNYATVSGRMINTETSEILWIKSVSGSANEQDASSSDLIASLASQLARKL